jgi:hypothetical protein
MFFLAVVNAITAGFAQIESDEKQTYANSKVSKAIAFEYSPGSTCGNFFYGMRVSQRNAFGSHDKFCSDRSEGAGCANCSFNSEQSNCSRDTDCSGSSFYACCFREASDPGASSADQGRKFFIVQGFGR